jgi:hypothetical protein
LKDVALEEMEASWQALKQTPASTSPVERETPAKGEAD